MGEFITKHYAGDIKMNQKEILQVLKNIYYYDTVTIKQATIAACNEIEELQKRIDRAIVALGEKNGT